MDACKLYPWGCYSYGDCIFYSRNNYYNRAYGNFRFIGVSRMGYVKLVASIILLAGMSTGSVLTDSKLTMVAILLAGFIAHGEG